jgi:hypothetical protein
MGEFKPLTVKEIKAILDKFPDDLPVMTHGFEEHFDPILEPIILNVKYNEENWDFCGMYESCDEGEQGSIEALVLFRDGRLS